MYSVFIVDDEMIVREGLRSKLDWEAKGFTFAGEAGDGELALSMIQDIKPDILITDIRMPFMDGLELATRAKKMQPWIHIIILSGHDEFDYAKRAISIGVDEYLLKPFTLEEVTESLGKVARTLDAERKKKQEGYHRPDEESVSRALSRAKLLSDLIYGTAGKDCCQRLRNDHGISLRAPFLTVTISEIHAASSDRTPLLSAQPVIADIESHVKHSIVFQLSPTTVAAIIKGSSRESSEERAFSFASMAQHQLSKDGVTLVTAIGSAVQSVEELPQSFDEADAILKRSHFSGKNRIIAAPDLEAAGDSSIVLQENDPLVDRLNYADESELDQIISEYIALLGENSAHFSIIASYLLVDVIMAVSKVIESLGGDVKEVMPEILSHTFVDRAVENEQIFIAEVRRVLTALLAYRNQHLQGRYAGVTLRAKRYIEQHYASPDISLKTVAEEVHLSPNHFSTIFSQDCGITFIEYLTRVRIEQAKHLLAATDRKSADIAYEVGFSDPHYFSFIFKKTAGMSPREWRLAQEKAASSR